MDILAEPKRKSRVNTTREKKHDTLDHAVSQDICRVCAKPQGKASHPLGANTTNGFLIGDRDLKVPRGVCSPYDRFLLASFVAVMTSTAAVLYNSGLITYFPYLQKLILRV